MTSAVTKIVTDAVANPCELFFNYFAVYKGQFSEMCGDVTVYGVDTSKNKLQSSYLSDQVSSDDGTFVIEDGELIAFTPMAVLDGDSWTIVFEGYSIKSSKTGFNIFLGPGGQSQNCQIRYENGNGICIYSYYASPSYSECISLPDDIDELHTLMLYYNNGVLSVYQNDKFVGNIEQKLQIAFSRIGGWYETYYGDVAIKRIMFSRSTDFNEVRSFVNNAASADHIFGENGEESATSSASSTVVYWLPCLLAVIGLVCCFMVIYMRKRNKFEIAPAADDSDNSFESVPTSTEQETMTQNKTKTGGSNGEDSMDLKEAEYSMEDGKGLTEGEELPKYTDTL